MKISVRLSAGLADQIGRSILTTELEESATIADLLNHLAISHPEIAEHLDTCVTVVAGQHVEPSFRLKSGQQVAVLIPISGGYS